MLCGNVVAIGSGGFICIIVSFITNRNYSSEMADSVWETTRDIDNPLSPWTEMYARDLNLSGANKLDNRPSLEEVYLYLLFNMCEFCLKSCFPIVHTLSK